MRFWSGLALVLSLSLSLAQGSVASLAQALQMAVGQGAEEVYLVLGNTVLGPQEVGRMKELVRMGAQVGIFADRCPEPRIMAGLPYYAMEIGVGGEGKREIYLLVRSKDRFLAAQGPDPRLLRVIDMPLPPPSHERDVLEFSLGFETFRQLLGFAQKCGL